MKKLCALLLAVLMLSVCGLTALAAGVDDGALAVATKDGKKYFGTEITQGCVKYVAANGSDDLFYDLTDDKDMNVCDLVALVNKEVDLDLSGTYDAFDAATLRLLLLGEAN